MLQLHNVYRLWECVNFSSQFSAKCTHNIALLGFLPYPKTKIFLVFRMCQSVMMSFFTSDFYCNVLKMNFFVVFAHDKSVWPTLNTYLENVLEKSVKNVYGLSFFFINWLWCRRRIWGHWLHIVEWPNYTLSFSLVD